MNESKFIFNTYLILLIKFRIFKNEFFFLVTFTWDPQSFRFMDILVNVKELRN